MPAEFGLDRLLRIGADLQREGRLLEGRTHRAGTEIAEIPAGRVAARIVRVLVGQLLEVRAGVELLDDIQRFLFRVHQNVTRLDLVHRRRLGNLLVVAGAHDGVGDLVGDLPVDQFAVQRTQLKELRPALEILVLS